MLGQRGTDEKLPPYRWLFVIFGTNSPQNSPFSFHAPHFRAARRQKMASAPCPKSWCTKVGQEGKPPSLSAPQVRLRRIRGLVPAPQSPLVGFHSCTCGGPASSYQPASGMFPTSVGQGYCGSPVLDIHRPLRGLRNVWQVRLQGLRGTR